METKAKQESRRGVLRDGKNRLNQTPPLSSKTQGAKNALQDEDEEAITVAVRMRPLKDPRQRVWEVDQDRSSVTQVPLRAGHTPTGPKQTKRKTLFAFDKAFGEKTSTQEVYDSTAKGIVSSVMSGLNGTIFAYGQTASGKTYTMQGGSAAEVSKGITEEEGIVHMAAADIFRHITESDEGREFIVRVSMLEIYNEEIRDLLTHNSLGADPLRICEDTHRGVTVECQEEVVGDAASLLQTFFRGDKARRCAATAMNQRSSRGHKIFRVTIESRERQLKPLVLAEECDDQQDGAFIVSALNLVDLAGSESVRHTGATGKRLKEGGMINQSLLALSRVIEALGTGKSHAGYRDSKLTRILQPSLEGNARISIICCATPSKLYLEETRSTLAFAARAKLVKTNAKVNQVPYERLLIRRLQTELAEARQEARRHCEKKHIKVLEQQAEAAEEAAKAAEEKLSRLQASLLNSGVLFPKTLSQQRKKRRCSVSEHVALPPLLLSPGPEDQDSYDRRSSLQMSSSMSRKKENKKKRRLSLTFQPASSHDSTSPGPHETLDEKKPDGDDLSGSTTSEFQLLRLAMSTKSRILKSLQERYDDVCRTLEHRDAELNRFNDKANSEKEERSMLLEQSRSVEEECDSLRVQLEEHQEQLRILSLAFEEKNRSVWELEQKLSTTEDERDQLEQENKAIKEQRDLQIEKSSSLESDLTDKDQKLDYVISSAHDKYARDMLTMQNSLEEKTKEKDELQSKMDKLLVDSQRKLEKEKSEKLNLEKKLQQVRKKLEKAWLPETSKTNGDQKQLQRKRRLSDTNHQHHHPLSPADERKRWVIPSLLTPKARRVRAQPSKRPDRRFSDVHEYQLLSPLDKGSKAWAFEQALSPTRKKKRGKRQGEEFPTVDTQQLLQIAVSKLKESKEKNKTLEQQLAAKEAAQNQEEELAKQHIDTLALIYNLAMELRDQGRLVEAEVMLRKASSGYQQLLGGRHEHTLTSVYELALVLKEQSKFSEAEALLRMALDGDRQQYGDKHQHTLTSLYNLALVLKDQGKLAEAETLLREASDRDREMLGDRHEQTLTSVYTLGVVLMSQEKHAEAEPLLRQALDGERKKLVGKDSLLISVQSCELALVLKNQGKLVEAESLLREALNRERQNQEGASEKNSQQQTTLTTLIYNLALVLKDQNQLAESETLLREALSVDRKVLGDQHEQTLTSLYVLALVLKEQGKLKEAKEVLRVAFPAPTEPTGETNTPLGDDQMQALSTINTLSCGAWVGLLMGEDPEPASPRQNDFYMSPQSTVELMISASTNPPLLLTDATSDVQNGNDAELAEAAADSFELALISRDRFVFNENATRDKSGNSKHDNGGCTRAIVPVLKVGEDQGDNITVTSDVSFDGPSKPDNTNAEEDENDEEIAQLLLPAESKEWGDVTSI